MKIVYLCPACLTELPADYPYDHVEIDRAVAGDRDLFVRLSPNERTEVVIAGLARGMTINRLAASLNWPFYQLQYLLPAEHPQSPESHTARAEQQVQAMWAKGCNDTVISAQTGINPTQVGRLRKTLGLPTHPRTRPRKRVAWA